MWRRVLVVLGVGVILTGATVFGAFRADYTNFDPKAMIPLIVLIAGAALTFLATVLV